MRKSNESFLISAGVLFLYLSFLGCGGVKYGESDAADSDFLGSHSVPATETQDSSGTGSSSENKANDARAKCARLMSTIGSSPGSNTDITGFIGSEIYATNGISLIKDVAGSLILLGTGPGVTIGTVQNLYGSLIVCNISVSNLNNVMGSLIVVNGNVGNINLVKGSVLVVHGAIQGQVSSSIGSVLAVP